MLIELDKVFGVQSAQYNSIRWACAASSLLLSDRLASFMYCTQLSISSLFVLL